MNYLWFILEGHRKPTSGSFFGVDGATAGGTVGRTSMLALSSGMVGRSPLEDQPKIQASTPPR